MKGRNSFWVLLGLMVLVNFGCGTSSSAHPNSDPANKHESLGSDQSGLIKETRSIQWRLARQPRGNVVQLFSVAKWCVHYPNPRISKVVTQERARAVFIKAFMTIFRRPAKNELCSALELGMKKTVVLSRQLGDRALYDKGVTPPEKRWPRSQK